MRLLRSTRTYFSKLLLPVLLLLLVAGNTALAQSHYGQRFLIAFPDTTRNYTGPLRNGLPDDARLVIFSSDTANVTVTAPGFTRQVTVVPDSSSTVVLTDPASRPTRIFFDLLNTASPEIINVTSDRPVALYCQFTTTFGSEGFTPLPVENWGTEYYAMSLRNHLIAHVYFTGGLEEQWAPADGPGELIVIAAENGTSVTIDAKADLIGPRNRTIMLNAGEAYRIETDSTLRKNNQYDTTTRDLSGTHITASKPIAVISGNTRTDGGSGADLTPVPPTGNSLRNTAIEWLPPVATGGTTFVYRPLFPVNPKVGEELIRVYATAPGTTTITPSVSGASRTINQGEFAQFSSFDLRSADTNEPFALRTDQPAQAMVITGSYVNADPGGQNSYYEARSWAPAMAELVPQERWISAGRFRTFAFPAALEHYAVITAEDSARLWLDGNPVAYDPQPVPGTTFHHARIKIPAGDHILRADRGRFNAVAYGFYRGYEAFRPPRTDKEGDGGDHISAPMHPSYYLEFISIAYAFPVAGIDAGKLPPDSLEFTRVDDCDSTVVTVERIGPLWGGMPLDVTLDPASTNVAAQIVPFFRSGFLAGYRIRFTPANPALDASGGAIVTTLPGKRWYIPYSYSAHAVTVNPDPVELLGVPANVQQLVSLTLTNSKPFNVTLVNLRLKNGTTGFSLPDLSMFPAPLSPNGSISVPLAFTGSDYSTLYRDTLLIEMEHGCGSFELPVSARTAPPNPTPVPLISGYDWKRRVVGSSNDTLSFIANAGSLEFTIREVTIINDAAGAFSLIAPDWRTIPPVQPGGRFPTGIRFTPPGAGTFAADIVLVTTDGDTARDVLRGEGVLPDISIPDIALGPVCIQLDGITDTLLTITNTSDVPLRIDSLKTGGADAGRLRIDTLGAGLPRTLGPGEKLVFPIHITTATLGAIDAAVRVYSNAAGGSVLARITGDVISCSSAGLTVDDHDFDSVFITLTKPGTVTLRNSGGGDVVVTGMRLIEDTASAFRVLSPVAPFIVPDGDTIQVQVTFTSQRVGLKTARIEFTTEVGTLYANLRGVGKKLTVPAFIRRDYHGAPGDRIVISVELEAPVAGVPLDSLDVMLGYHAELLDYLAITGDSINQGWMPITEQWPDSLHFRLYRPGMSLDTGRILSLRFLTRFTLLDTSELPFTIESGLPYLEFVEYPGLFRRDSLCGLLYRLFESSPFNLRLEQNVPNPAPDATTIEFELPFDNPTTLFVYDILGTERLRLVDGMTSAGVHVITIPDGDLAAGQYFYRLRSGSYDLRRRMVIE